MWPRKMIQIPLPSRFSVTMVISDGEAYVSQQFDRRQLEDQRGALVLALEALDAELVLVNRPQDRLRQAIDDVARYREEQRRKGDGDRQTDNGGEGQTPP